MCSRGSQKPSPSLARPSKRGRASPAGTRHLQLWGCGQAPRGSLRLSASTPQSPSVSSSTKGKAGLSRGSPVPLCPLLHPQSCALAGRDGATRALQRAVVAHLHAAERMSNGSRHGGGRSAPAQPPAALLPLPCPCGRGFWEPSLQPCSGRDTGSAPRTGSRGRFIPAGPGTPSRADLSNRSRVRSKLGRHFSVL